MNDKIDLLQTLVLDLRRQLLQNNSKNQKKDSFNESRVSSLGNILDTSNQILSPLDTILPVNELIVPSPVPIHHPVDPYRPPFMSPLPSLSFVEPSISEQNVSSSLSQLSRIENQMISKYHFNPIDAKPTPKPSKPKKKSTAKNNIKPKKPKDKS